MTASRDCLQPAFVLNLQKYRETSLLLNVLTRDGGRLPLLAQGVRKAKSKTAALLQPFVPLSIGYVGKGELATLTAVEAIPPLSPLQGLSLYCGFYVNELVVRFLHPHDPHPEVFAAYRQCLDGLAQGQAIQAALRRFELDLLDCTGYGVDFAHEAISHQAITPHLRYQFKKGLGLVQDENGPFSGLTLQALDARDLTHPQVLAEAKLLMRRVINGNLQGPPLKSRTVIRQILASHSGIDGF